MEWTTWRDLLPHMQTALRFETRDRLQKKTCNAITLVQRQLIIGRFKQLQINEAANQAIDCFLDNLHDQSKPLGSLDVPNVGNVAPHTDQHLAGGITNTRANATSNATARFDQRRVDMEWHAPCLATRQVRDGRTTAGE